MDSSTNKSWPHGLKARNEQQKECDYFKNKPFSKGSKYFWNACKKLLEKTSYPEAIVRRCSLKEVFLKISQNLLEITSPCTL